MVKIKEGIRPKIIILSSNALRHNFLVNTFSEHFDIVGVVREEKTRTEHTEEGGTQTLTDQHMMDRDHAEENFFAEHQRVVISRKDILGLSRGDVNSPQVFAWVRERNPEYIVLFGTSIIENPLLSFYKDRMVNMHLGLSPYYRGSGTNFWPLVDGLPECVGATIHLATPIVDGGSILTQVRPGMSEDDTCHSIGCKTIIAGTESYAHALLAYHRGVVVPLQQKTGGGKVFRRKDFCEDAVRTMKANFAAGMIKKYLDAKDERDAVYPIVSTEFARV